MELERAGMEALEKFLIGHPRYQQVQYLSHGAYGFVTQALDKETGGYVALKFIQRGSKITKYVEREILNQLRLRHPHIIELKEVFLTEEHLVLVMEYAGGGDLLARVTKAKRLSEDDARWFFQQIMFAVDYCHKMGVANRDIKLDNTLLQDSGPRALVKLADFGFSKDENYQSAPGSRVGTPAYLAPEVISNVDGKTYDAKKADVWSCGVLLFVMVAGRYPFQRAEDQKLPSGQRMHAMLQRIVRCDYRFPTSHILSDPCRDLIARLLIADPLQRLSVQEVLHHPWTAHGLQPAVLSFNDPIVASSLASPPPPQVVEEIRSIVEEAATLPGELHTDMMQQGMAQEPGVDDSLDAALLKDDVGLDLDTEDFDLHPL